MLSSKVSIWALTCAGLWLGCQHVSGADKADKDKGVIRDPKWIITIRPAAKLNASEEAPAPESVAAKKSEPSEAGPELIGPPTASGVEPPRQPIPAARMSYAQAYALIPFSRTEYEANPAYRHQAALELMFGVLRPTTLVQQYTPRAFRYPDFYQMPYGRLDTQHINVRHYGGGYNFNGQSPFGYPYGLRGNW